MTVDWCAIMIAVTAYNGITVPIRIVFSASCGFLFVDILLDALLLLDIYIHSHMSYLGKSHSQIFYLSSLIIGNWIAHVHRSQTMAAMCSTQQGYGGATSRGGSSLMSYPSFLWSCCIICFLLHHYSIASGMPLLLLLERNIRESTLYAKSAAGCLGSWSLSSALTTFQRWKGRESECCSVGIVRLWLTSR